MLVGEWLTDAATLVDFNSRMRFYLVFSGEASDSARDTVMVLCGCARGRSDCKSSSKLLLLFIYCQQVDCFPSVFIVVQKFQVIMFD